MFVISKDYSYYNNDKDNIVAFSSDKKQAKLFDTELEANNKIKQLQRKHFFLDLTRLKCEVLR